MPSDERFDWVKFVTGPFNWRTYVKLFVFLLALGVAYSVVHTIWERFFPKRQVSTSTTSVGHVESGGVANITNVIQQSAPLRQGVYLRGSNDRVSAGVFKELTPNIELGIGGGRELDGDHSFVEVEARIKF